MTSVIQPASACVTPVKVHGSDIPGSDFNETDKAGLDNQITRQWQWKLELHGRCMSGHPHKKLCTAFGPQVSASHEEPELTQNTRFVNKIHGRSSPKAQNALKILCKYKILVHLGKLQAISALLVLWRVCPNKSKNILTYSRCHQSHPNKVTT